MLNTECRSCNNSYLTFLGPVTNAAAVCVGPGHEHCSFLLLLFILMHRRRMLGWFFCCLFVSFISALQFLVADLYSEL